MFDFFDYFAPRYDYTNTKLFLINEDYLRHMLLQINFHDIFTEKTTLRDIQIYVISFLNICIDLQMHYEESISELNNLYTDLYEKQENNLRIKEFMSNIVKIMSVLTISENCIYYANAFTKALPIVINTTGYAAKIFVRKLLITIYQLYRK